MKPSKFLIYLSCFALIFTLLFFEVRYLSVLLPVILGFILVPYIYENRQLNNSNPNIPFLLSILCLMFTYNMIYSDYYDYFTYICISVFIYTILTSFSLFNYILNIRVTWKQALSLPFIISGGLIGYLIFSFSQLTIATLPDAEFEIYLLVFGLVFYSLITYYVYISNAYLYGFNLLISIIILIAVVGLTSINELYLHCRICSFFISFTHIIGIYLFMKFLVLQDPNKLEHYTNDVLDE